MKKIIFLMSFLLICLSSNVYAWNSNGHRLVAQIAYNHLSHKTKIKLAKILIGYDDLHYFHRQFLYAATWPDRIKKQDVTAFNSWHYIDIPYVQGNFRRPYIPQENVAWAIQKSIQVLLSPNASTYNKRLFLKFLLHFVADIHQPLHCAELVSSRFPKGDEGGTLYSINMPHFNNLHMFWDAGLGFFTKGLNTYSLSNRQVKTLARKIQQTYPQYYFGREVANINFYDWAYQSYNLAKKYVYKTPYNAKPSAQYIKHGQKIAEQQIALAGYRLAYLLNQIELHPQALQTKINNNKKRDTLWSLLKKL